MVQLTAEETTRRLGIQTRNADRAHRRDDPANQRPVSDDEPDLTGAHHDEWADEDLDVLRQLPAAQFRAVMRLAIKGEGMKTAPNLPVVPLATAAPFAKDAVVFRVADEKVSSRTGRTYEIADAIWYLVQAGVYIILPTLTTASLRELATNPGCMKTRKGLDAVGSKRVLLDQSMFGKEGDLPENLWHEAWHNQDAIFSATCEPAIYSYFKTHRTFCSSQEQFSENYPAILAFDSYIRRTYVHTRVRLSESEYTTKYTECKIQAMLDKMDRALCAPLPLSQPSARYEPYPGRQADEPIPRGAASFCLICAGEGHMASACTKSTTERGTDVVSVLSDGRLLLAASWTGVCISYNLRSDCRSGHNGRLTTAHVCSLCGSREHHAASRKCL
jgi:hypothetical protein